VNATLRTILREAGIAVGLTTAVGLFGYQLFGSRLAAARHEAVTAAQELQHQVQSERYAWVVANESVKLAAAAKGRADAARDTAQHVSLALAVANGHLKALGAAPDTCKPWVAAATGARDLANETAQHWKAAYDAQVEAAGHLKTAIDTVHAADSTLVPAADSAVKATQELVKASKPSFGKMFLHLLRPKINIDAVTLDPVTKKIEAGPKIGLGWSISI
jgi:hypothetical protein